MSAAYDDETYRDVFGLRTSGERAYAAKLVDALAKVDPSLVPRGARHPFAQQIQEGGVALPALLAVVENGAPRARFDALDAVAHIFTSYPVCAPREALARIAALLPSARDGDSIAALMKTLAMGRDDAFLHTQIERLGDEDPGLVASAARLLGFGRYKPALPVLRALVSPARFVESRSVLWALGEIGDAAALPELHAAIENAFRVNDALIAVGKVGQLASLGHVTPLIQSGTADQRDAGYRALAMILDKNRDVAPRNADLALQLGGIIETQLTRDEVPLGSTRFFMALCLARLGKKLDMPRMRQLLGLPLDEDVSELASYFLTRGKKPR